MFPTQSDSGCSPPWPCDMQHTAMLRVAALLHAEAPSLVEWSPCHFVSHLPANLHEGGSCKNFSLATTKTGGPSRTHSRGELSPPPTPEREGEIPQSWGHAEEGRAVFHLLHSSLLSVLIGTSTGWLEQQHLFCKHEGAA